jgi:hypothetical protein
MLPMMDIRVDVVVSNRMSRLAQYIEMFIPADPGINQSMML